MLSDKKLDTKDYICYDSICMKYREQVNPKRKKMDLWLPGAIGR